MKSGLFLVACSLVACATESKAPIEPEAIEAIRVEGKDDSLYSPTYKGTVAMGDVVNGRVTRQRTYHAWDYTYVGQSGLVRLDLKNYAGADMALVVYRRGGGRWNLVDWNDDCGDGSLNSCLFVDAAGGEKYRFVVTTFDALVGYPRQADYELGVSCKDGDCLSRACGGLLGLQCGEGEYCQFAEGDFCGFADATGTCQPIPWACTQEYAPVCGCNGETYGNACEAAAAGTSVASEGPCEVACGARAGDTCTADQYCRFERSAICGQADGQGVCEDRPQFCTAQYDPVCGCDGQTYSNECAAAAAGMGVLADGPCAAMP